jgi:predicted ATPase/class 3 adenylate cyclase
MHCPACNAENRAGRRFCASCGQSLPRSADSLMPCGHCGFLNEPGAQFCGGCACKLQALNAPLPEREGERRQVTILFCDLVGSTALSNALDPEDMRIVIRAYQAVATDAMERQGGFVARYMGDGLMVYFGYPQGYEDAAERAVRAALDVVGEVTRLRPLPQMDLRLEARVGIATGLAVVGDLIGKGASREEAVVGPTPNLAARLQGLADPGGVVISEQTQRLVSGLFQCEDLGRHKLKGFDDSIPAWSVVDERSGISRFSARRPGYRQVRLIGRREQRDQLDAAWARSRTGEGQVITLRGDAGVGKSRIVQALRERLQAEPHTELSFHCSPRFSNTALYPITSQLRRDAGLTPSDPPDLALKKLAGLLADFDQDAGTSDALPYLATLLSVPLGEHQPTVATTPERQKARLFELLEAKLAKLAAQQPVLLLFEDLHWVDPTTAQLIEQLIGIIAGLPVLLVVTARPDFEPPWAGHPGTATVVLPGLDREGSLELIDGISGRRPLPPEVLEQILDKSDGVPLFVEEITKAVLESGLLREVGGRYVLTGPLPGFAVPSTLRDTLMARLDRLGAAKEMAQVGAVIGREFSLPLLAAVSARPEHQLRPAIAQLVDSDLVECGTADDGTAVCLFKHALLQEAAHSTLLRRNRQQLHRRVAEALEQQSFGVAEEASPELLAHHYAAAQMPERAIPYLQRAGMRASERAAHTEAIRHYRAAADMLMELPKNAERHQLELGIRVHLGLSLSAARGYAAPDVEDTYQRARELCHLLGEGVDLFPVIRGLCTFYIVRAQLSTAREIAEQCVRLGEQSTEAVHLIEGYTALGYTEFFLGDLTEAEIALQRSLDAYRANDGHLLNFPTPQDPAISDLSLLALAAWMRGDDALSLAHSRGALDIAARLGRPFDAAYARCFAAMLHNIRGEPEQAGAHAAEAIALSQRYGFDIWLAAGTLQAAIAQGALGDADVAAELMTATLKAWEAAGAGLNQSFFFAGLAQVQRRRGAINAALEAVERALDHAGRHRERFFDAVIYRLRGELRAELPHLAHKAEADLLRALDIARVQDAPMLELDALASLHRLHRRTGSGEDPYLAPLRELHHLLRGVCANTVPMRRVARLLQTGDPARP